MTTNVKESQHSKHSGALQTVEKDIHPIQAFGTKFNNDWSMNFSAALAYNLLMAMFPIAIAILSILGFFLGGAYRASIDDQIKSLLPGAVSGSVIEQINTQLTKNAGPLGLIAIILAL